MRKSCAAATTSMHKLYPIMAHPTPGEFARVFQSVKRPKGDCDLHEMKEKVQNVSEVCQYGEKKKKVVYSD